MLGWLVEILIAVGIIKVGAKLVPGEAGKTFKECSNILDSGLAFVNNQLADVNDSIKPEQTKKAK